MAPAPRQLLSSLGNSQLPLLSNYSTRILFEENVFFSKSNGREDVRIF